MGTLYNMANPVEHLLPEKIWQHFYSLTQIPRPSHHEERVQQFMLSFGEELGLEVERDTTGNVIIRKPATRGFELSPTVILQGHLDMVPQANEGSIHNFAEDSLKLLIEDDWLTADGTTLGADNGIGVAAAMALLGSNDINHGPLEALFTANEEDGMEGALAVQAGQLSGSILLNMDSEEEGVLTVGCAGGINATGKIELQRTNLEHESIALQIKVRGLRGGHSGVDIYRGRGNANKVLGRLLAEATKQGPIQLCDFDGGSLRNAIPREASAVIALPNYQQAAAEKLLAETFTIIKKELDLVEPCLVVAIEVVSLPPTGLTLDSTRLMLDLLQTTPHGIVRMSDTMPGLVETSSNLAIVKLHDSEAEFHCLLRSSVDSARDDLCEHHQSLFRLAGGSLILDGAYPGWKPNLDSAVLKVMQSAHLEVFGNEAEIGGIHAGLECGILGAPMPHLDMISFGPTIEFPHGPDERMYIPSVGRFWSLLVATVERISKIK